MVYILLGYLFANENLNLRILIWDLILIFFKVKGPLITQENQMKEICPKSVKISSIRSNVDH